MWGNIKVFLLALFYVVDMHYIDAGGMLMATYEPDGEIMHFSFNIILGK